MDQEKYENQQKDKILQQFHDACEDARWGSGKEKTTIKIVFDGYLSVRKTEVLTTNHQLSKSAGQ